MTLRITQATLSHLRTAADDLSKGDLQEFHCMIANRDPRDVLPAALNEDTHAILAGSFVIAVGGVTDDCIWFVTTNAREMLGKAERKQFYKLLKEHLADVRDKHNRIFTNLVSKDNALHIRLLESLGATFQTGHTMSPAGFPFKQFWL